MTGSSSIERELSRRIKAMPWSERPPKDLVRYLSSIIEQTEPEVPGVSNIRALLSGQTMNGQTLLVLNDVCVIGVVRDEQGVEPLAFDPTKGDSIFFQNSEGMLGQGKLDALIVTRTNVRYIPRCHAETALDFAKAVDGLRDWRLNSGQEVPLACFACGPVNTAYGLPGVERGTQVVAAFTNDHLGISCFSTGEIVEVDYSRVDTLQVLPDAQGLPQLVVEGVGFSFRAAIIGADAHVADALLAPVVARARSAIQSRQEPRPAANSATDGGGEPASVRIAEAIRQLAALRDEGLISEDVFVAKRTELLEQM